MESKENIHLKSDNVVQEATLKSLRNAIMHSITAVRNDEMEANDAIAISKLGNTMIDSYKVEIDAVKVADSLKERNISYSKSIPLLNIAEG